MSAPDRRGLLQRDHESLSIRRQCQLLSVARSSVYRPPRPANDNDLELMRRIDQLFTAWPFLGSRRMTAMLNGEGCRINRKRVQRLMRKMGIAALGPKPRTTKPAPGHKIFPYLLRHMVIDRPNQVWAADITYVPIGQGFLYLVAIIDRTSRAVLAWRLSNTMDTSFCVSALEEALARFGRPEIFNTDQGSQFTSAAFTGTVVGGRTLQEFISVRCRWRAAFCAGTRRDSTAKRIWLGDGARSTWLRAWWMYELKQDRIAVIAFRRGMLAHPSWASALIQSALWDRP
ncbi:hypothetical protein CV770_40955 [Bradyrhizobium sp. AC87j1]|nr:hypothetical protein CV770_40955 [Bradyrhizobium sp. AC87j1]